MSEQVKLADGVDWRTLGALLADPDVEGKRFIAESDVAAVLEQRDQAVNAFIEAVRFEAGCMRHYADEKPGMLAKLAGEMVEPIEQALAAIDQALPDGGGES